MARSQTSHLWSLRLILAGKVQPSQVYHDAPHAYPNAEMQTELAG